MEFDDNVYVQFLGFSANPEYQPEPELLEIECEYGGRLFKPDKLPRDFRVTHAALGDYFLKYKEEAVFRIFWIKKGGKWFNYTHDKFGDPKEEWEKHIKDLPWHNKQ